MNDVPICRVISYDCRVRGKDLWVGEVCAHVRVYRVFVGVLFLFYNEFSGISGSKWMPVDARSKLGNKEGGEEEDEFENTIKAPLRRPSGATTEGE
jgi:hypothetical protein